MSELEIAESQTKTDLTKTQKESGNYDKGRVTLKNIPITIENPKGSTRSGYSPEGKRWESKMNFTYGYIDNSIGVDGDELDVYLGPLADTEQDFLVYIINQVDPITKKFDEHKIMFGFSNSSEAKKAYLSCYEEGWQGYGSMDQISLTGFNSWIRKKSNEVFINQLNPIKNEVVKNQSEKLRLIKLCGEVLLDKTLSDLQTQAGDLKGITTLIISIESPGGDVSEGIKIMMWLDYISSLGVKVVSIVLSNAYSIASLIMLAADHVLIAKDADVMVHNPMIPELKLVNANELETHIRDLRLLESTMYELYEIFTDLTIEEIKELMDNETYITAENAVKLGFADEVADIEKRPKVMAQSKTNKIDMRKTLNILNGVLAMVSGSAIVNQMYYNDEGGEIEIYQQDPSAYQTGDRTNLQQGEVKLQDGSVLTIEDYVIKSINKDTPAPVVTEPTPAAVTEPAPVVEPAQAQFNQGPAPVKPEEPAMKTEVTKTETTKTEPVAVVAAAQPASPGASPVVPQEPQGPAAVVEEPAVAAPVAEEVMDPNCPETITVPMKEFQDLVANYKALADKVAKLESGASATEEKMVETEEFKELASAAIEMIAKNTVSNFTPVAKAKAEPATGGKTIFQRAKERVEATKAK
jgi:ATP-dependent protease ClpP protease subunit